MDCVDTQMNDAHCGMCGEACPTGTSCQGGDCVCDGGGQLCGDTCVDVMNDDQHCGGCDHDCLGGTCSLGLCAPDTLANDVAQVFSLVVEGGTVYFARSGLTNAIYEVPADGTSAATILENNQTFPRHIASDGTNLYWTLNGTNDDAGVVEYPLPNGPPNVLVNDEPNGTWGLVLDSGFVFIANQEADSVKRVDPAAPGSPLNIGTLQARPWDISVEGNFVYWTNYDSGDIRRAPVGGGQAPQLVAGAQGNPLGIATDATHVYWAGETSGNVARVPLAGGNPEIIASGQLSPTYVALDATHVYWTSFGNGTVNRAPKAGGEVVVLANGQNQPYDVTVDATHVYWTTLAGGTVMRVPK